MLFDPQRPVTIRHKNLHSGCGYTLFEGRECLGAPVLTMQRGRVLVEDGKMKEEPGKARFLPTKIGKP